MKTQQILNKINSNGGEIALDGESLKLNFPEDFDDQDLLSIIRLNKGLLIEELKQKQSIPLTIKKEGFIVTPGQKGLWIQNQIENSSKTYHITTIFDIEGSIDYQVFKESLSILIKRHEILRTTFYSEEGEVYQTIHEEGTLKISFELFEEFRNNIIEELIENHSDKLFDLKNESLFRCLLIKEKENKYILGLTLHHIISDGWSVSILIKELLLIYGSLCKGNRGILPMLRLQFKDYAEWQLKQLNLKRESKEYWKEKLSGELPILELLGYQSRPTIKTYKGDRILLSIDNSKVQKWKERMKENEATLFMGLLSGLNAILYKYTSQNDFIIGTPVAGRNHKDLHNQIGFYVNTLPLKVSIEDKKCFKDTLLEVKQTVLEAFEYQDYAFDSILQDVSHKRDLSRSPLFDCMLVLQSNEKIEIKSKNIQVFQRDNTSKSSKYDLSFIFLENKNNTLTLELEYNTDIYQRFFIKQLGNHYISLMSRMIEDSEIPINDLNYLSKDEENKLLYEFNDTKIPYPKGKTIVDLFEEQVKKAPDKVAVVFEGKELTYKKLDEKSNQLANYLRNEYKIIPEDFIGIKLERSELLLVAIFGVLKSGGAYVPIDPSYPDKRVNYIEKDCKCKVILDENEFEKFERIRTNIETSKPDVDLKSSNLAYVIYTSGSTGKPKGVMVEHGNVVRLAKPCSFFPLCEDNILLSTGSVSFDATILEYYGTLLNGAKLVLAPKNKLLEITEFKKVVSLNYIDSLWMSSSWFNRVVDTDLTVFKRINQLIVGGDIVSPLHVSKVFDKYPSIKMINGYGPTENTTFSTTYAIENKSYTTIPIGSAIPNSSIYILNNNLEPLPIGVVGNIYVSGKGVSRGYLNNSDLTDKKFICNPYVKGERLYNTGDLGRWLPNGTIEFLGRKDNQIKIRGYRVEIGEIESSIFEFSKNIEQVYVGVKERNSDKVLIAYIISKGKLDRQELREFLLKKLPKYMIPNYFMELKAFPLTSHGKINISLLPNISQEDLIRNEYVAPQGYIETVLVKIWSEELGTNQIGVTDNFFELGGNSLKMLSINSSLDRLGLNVSFTDIYSSPTIRQLSPKIIMSNGQNNLLECVEEEDKKYYKLSPKQKRWWGDYLEEFSSEKTWGNLVGVQQLDVQFDLQIFKRAMREFLRNHEIFRSNFIKRNGEIFQTFSDDLDINIETINISSDDNYHELHKIILKIKHRVFDFKKGKLLKLIYIKSNKKDFLIFNTHHILIDGISLGIMSNRIKEYYRLIELNKEIPPEKIQHKNISEYQNKMYLEVTKKSRSYWVNKFKYKIKNYYLPRYYKNTKNDTRGADFIFVLPKKLDACIATYAKNVGVSKFIVIFSIYNILMMDLIKSKDMIIGSPLNGRENQLFKDCIGFFINLVLLRVELEDSDSFVDFINKVNQTYIDALVHQEYQINDIVNDIGYVRNSSSLPITTSYISQLEYNHDYVGENYVYEDTFCDSRVDLMLYVEVYNGKTLFRFTHKKVLFNEKILKTMCNKFEYLALDLIETNTII